MIPLWLWVELRYFDASRDNYLAVSSYTPKSWIFTLCFWFSQEPIFILLILYLWRILLLLTLFPLSFLFKRSINGLLQTMIHSPTTMEKMMQVFLSINYIFSIIVKTRNKNVSDITNEYMFIYIFLIEVYNDRSVVLTYDMLILCLSTPFQNIKSKTMMMFLV